LAGSDVMRQLVPEACPIEGSTRQLAFLADNGRARWPGFASTAEQQSQLSKLVI
jgi:hypothetical protein